MGRSRMGGGAKRERSRPTTARTPRGAMRVIVATEASAAHTALLLLAFCDHRGLAHEAGPLPTFPSRLTSLFF